MWDKTFLHCRFLRSGNLVVSIARFFRVITSFRLTLVVAMAFPFTFRSRRWQEPRYPCLSLSLFSPPSLPFSFPLLPSFIPPTLAGGFGSDSGRERRSLPRSEQDEDGDLQGLRLKRVSFLRPSPVVCAYIRDATASADADERRPGPNRAPVCRLPYWRDPAKSDALRMPESLGVLADTSDPNR